MKYIGIHKKGDFSFSNLIRLMKKKSKFDQAGAIATFIGVVRGVNLKGEKVKKLELEAYEDQANSVLGEICEDLKKRKGVVDVQIHHMVGEFSVGEDLVYIVVAGAHRKSVFEVLQKAVERYKSETPVFKKEHILNKLGKNESYWVSEKEIQKNRKNKSHLN